MAMHANNLFRAALSQRSPPFVLRLASHPTLTPSPALLSRRHLSTNNGAPSLQSSRIGDKPGVEGLHQRTYAPIVAPLYQLTPYTSPCPDDSKAVSVPDPSNKPLGQPPVLKGDWVLFHPVYTPEELRAVEVGDVLPSISRSPDS